MTRFSVEGVRGQGRPRFAGGRAYKARADREWEEAVRAAYLEAGGTVHEGPVSVRIDVERPLPKSAPKRVASAPDTLRPDADNVAKGVLDALNGAAWADDSQVTSLVVEKRDRRRAVRASTTVEVLGRGTPWEG